MTVCWDCLDGKHTGWCKNCTCTACARPVARQRVERAPRAPRTKRTHVDRVRGPVGVRMPGGVRGPKKGSLNRLAMDPAIAHAIAEGLAGGGTLSGLAREFHTTREKVRTIRKHLEALCSS